MATAGTADPNRSVTVVVRYSTGSPVDVYACKAGREVVVVVRRGAVGTALPLVVSSSWWDAA